MTTQAVLTLLDNDQDVLKAGADSLSPRGCEFVCNEEQISLFREEADGASRYQCFKIKLALYPHTGPRPQYVSARGQITSIRRCAQDTYKISLLFQEMQQDGYRLIAEHLTPVTDIKLELEQSKSA